MTKSPEHSDNSLVSANTLSSSAKRMDSALSAPSSASVGQDAMYDEMFQADGEVRPAYAPLNAHVARLSPAELGDRQKTLERSFLLQGITFTVYGADSSTERIIPTDLFPRIIDATTWDRIELGLKQRLLALNMFLSDLYGAQKILMDGIVPRDLVLGAPSYRREMVGLYVPNAAYANVCGSDLIRNETGEFMVLEDNLGCRPACPICWPTETPPSARSRKPSARRGCGLLRTIRTCSCPPSRAWRASGAPTPRSW